LPENEKCRHARLLVAQTGRLHRGHTLASWRTSEIGEPTYSGCVFLPPAVYAGAAGGRRLPTRTAA
jgi:hypothetical protein